MRMLLGSEDNVKLPWLEKHIEVLRMREVVEIFKKIYVPTSEEIIRYVGERYKRLRPRRRGIKGRIEFEVKRLELVYNIVRDKLAQLLELPPLNKMDEFHRLLISTFVGEEYDKALRRIRLSIKLAKNFWDEYRILILSSRSVEEAKKYRREGCGRILSLVRRLSRQLELLRKVREEVMHTHVISEGLPIVVVAGIPSAGKSTLISKLSTAKPEIAPYPFTTKTIIVGKCEHNSVKFYIVDTPGILERPSTMHNEMEKKALVALSVLPDLILFLFDVSKERVQDINEQIQLLDNIMRTIVVPREKRVVIALNKIDVVDEQALKELNKYLEDIKSKYGNYIVAVLEISALKGYGLTNLLNVIIDALKPALGKILGR